MMLDPIEAIRGALPGRDIGAVPGRLECQTETVADAAQVVAKFSALGGEGWLCSAESREIRRFSPAQPLPAASGAAPWPMCGEAVSGSTSVHLQRDSDGWRLTTIARLEAATPDDVIVEGTLQARDGQGDLRYETAWRNTTVAGLDELRPHAFRFVGFVTREREV